MPNPASGIAIYGQPVQLTAKVTSPGGAVTVGAGSSVKFVDTTTGATLGSANIGAGGMATITTTALTATSHTITATYTDGADSYFNGAPPRPRSSTTMPSSLQAAPSVASLISSAVPTPGTTPIPASGRATP